MKVNVNFFRYSWIQISTLISGFLNSVLIARFLSINQYGSYSLIIKSTNIATIVFSFGISNSIQNYPNFLISHKKYFLKILLAIVILQSFVIYTYSISLLHDGMLSLCAVFLGMTNILLLIISNYELAVGKTNDLIFTRTFMPTMLTLFLLISLFSNFYFLSKLINLVILVTLLNLVIVLFKGSTFRIEDKKDRESNCYKKGQFFVFGLKTFPALAIRSFHLSLDLLILGFILNPKKLSEYAICVTIAGLSSLPIFVYSTDKQIHFKNIALLEGRRIIANKVIRNFLPLSIIWSTAIFTAVYCTNGVFFFDISAVSFLILVTLMLANIVDGIVLIFSSLAVANGYNKENTQIQLTGFVVNIILMILLVPKMQGIGAAIASLCSYSLCLFQSYRKIC